MPVPAEQGFHREENNRRSFYFLLFLQVSPE